MARKRKVSEDSDSEEFDEPELSLQDEPKNIKRKKSTGPGDILVRLCESIMQRDSYRFFSIPVNVKKVTDYLRIIKAPMDLGTMKKKAQKREYSSLEEFQADFDLIVSNAKLYNGPDSVYSKEAEKLHEYGKKLIANEMLNQLTAPVADSQSASGKSHESSEKGTPRLKSRSDRNAPVRYIESQAEKPQTRRSAKKVKHWEDLELLLFDIFNDDGSKVEIEAMNIEKPKFDPFTFYAQCIGPNLLQSLSTIVLEPIKHWNTGVLSPLGSVLTPAEVENTALAYGDERGKAYISSLERFTKNLKPEDFDIAKHTEILTRGAHKVYVATEAYLENGVDPGIVVAECGQVNISGQIEECKSEVDKYLDFLDLDIAKTSANSCAELTRNLVQEDLQKPADPEFLAENLRDFKLILEDQVSAEEKVQLLDKIKLRLFLLVRYSNDPSFDYGQRAAMMNAAAQQQQLAYAQFASALQGNPGMQRGPIPNQMNPALMRASANFQGLPQNQQQLLIQQQQIQMQQRLQQQQILQQRMQAQGQQMMAGQQIQAPKQMMANQMGLQNQQLLPGRQIPASPFQHLPQQQVRNCANCGNVCPVNAGAPLCYGNDI